MGRLEEIKLTPNQARLMRFVMNHVGDGVWTHLGEDAFDDIEVLEEHGLVETRGFGGSVEDKPQYRLAISEVAGQLLPCRTPSRSLDPVCRGILEPGDFSFQPDTIETLDLVGLQRVGCTGLIMSVNGPNLWDNKELVGTVTTEGHRYVKVTLSYIADRETAAQ